LYSNIGESQLALGRLDEAQTNFDRALTIFGWSLPANHPDLALPLKGRGQVALADGRPAQAVEDLERALTLQLEVSAEPLEIADLRVSLAHALRASEGPRSTRAKALALEARATFEEVGMRERVSAINDWLRR
jgi:tetratricopeptide (TPR) repeat protein